MAYSSASTTFALQINKGIVAFVIPLSACLNVVRCLQKMLTEHIPEFKAGGKRAVEG